MARHRLSSLLITLARAGLLFAALAVLSARRAAAADGVVNTCNDATFSAVLNTVQGSGGGTITFSCSGAIVLDSTKTITSNVTIDGGGVITLSSGKARLAFQRRGQLN
jgi:putative intracellular protease/amidase